MEEMKRLHPGVLFFYFASVIGFAMVLEHPLLIAISLGCSLLAAVSSMGFAGFKRELKYYFISYLTVVLLTPIISQRGATTWFTILGHRITVEAVVYGICMGASLSAIIIWFRSFSNAINGDKIIYLFGRILPSLGVALSMVLGFVDKFTSQYQKIRFAQKALGESEKTSKFTTKAKRLMNVFSVLLTWGLENSIETADAMDCRGYGTGRRSFFSIYRMGKTEYWLLAFLTVVDITLFLHVRQYAAGFMYYPYITAFATDYRFILTVLCFTLLGVTPIFVQLLKERKWKQLQSNI